MVDGYANRDDDIARLSALVGDAAAGSFNVHLLHLIKNLYRFTDPASGAFYTESPRFCDTSVPQAECHLIYHKGNYDNCTVIFEM